MNRNELVEQINGIEETLKASGKYMFNGKRLIVAGILFLFIPLIQYGINQVFWKISLIQNNIRVGILINIIMYITIFKLTFIITKTSRSNHYHPSVNTYVQKAIGLHDVIIKTMLISVIILSVSGYSNLAFPFVYILLGFIYNLFGRFSLDIIKKISISYIVIGLVSIFFANYSNILWQLLLIYLGLTYIIMGNILERNR